MDRRGSLRTCPPTIRCHRSWSCCADSLDRDDMQHGIDESKVREGLRKVSEMPARRRIQLLTIEPKVACFLNQSLAQFACAIRLTYLGQSRDQPE